MNKQDYMKLQTCVIKLNTQCACDGCKQKIKKLLNKVDGVYKTSIDLEQGKVTVSGNADPDALIKKLNKSGKHAELWGPQKGMNVLNNQFKNMGFDNKNQKRGGDGGGKDSQKDVKGLQQMQAAMNKGFKDFKPPNKDQKLVKFNLPVGGGGGGGGFDDEYDFDDEDSFDDEDDFDDEFDDEDDFDDEFDDEDDDSFDGEDKKPNNMKAGPRVGGHGPHGPIAMMNGKKGPGAGFGLPVQFKGKGGNNDNAKNGNDGKKGGGGGGDGDSGKKGKGGKDGSSGGGFGGFFGGAFLGGGKKKHSDSSPKGGKKGADGGGGQAKGGNRDKKGEGKHHDEGKFSGGNKQSEFLDFSKPHNGGGGRNMAHNGGGNGGGRNVGHPMGGNPMMPQKGNFPMGQMGGHPMGQMPSAQGLPMAYRGQGMDHGNPFNQQQRQYMMQQQQQQQQQQHMQAMMMNQQRANMYPQMMYGHMPPHAAYGPPMGAPVNDNITHIFSDENTDSCSIM